MTLSNSQPLDAIQLFRALLHDLANPLSIIMSSASCLQITGAHAPDPHDMIERIQRAAKEQQHILEFGKHIGKIAALQLSGELFEVNLDQVAHNTVAKFKDELTRKSIGLEFCIEDDLDAVFLAEPHTFQVVVMEALISNALRFSAPDTTIQVIAQRQDDIVEVKVIDQGVGMKARTLAQLFDIRSRLREPDTEGHIGLGLALLLVKFYVDSCSGTIVVTSRCQKPECHDHGTEVAMRFRAPPMH